MIRRALLTSTALARVPAAPARFPLADVVMADGTFCDIKTAPADAVERLGHAFVQFAAAGRIYGDFVKGLSLSLRSRP